MDQDALVRPATIRDLDALMALETAGFPIDSFSRRQVRHYVTEAHAATLVIEVGRRVQGYAVMGWRAGSTTGTLYSIVTAPTHQRRGLGSRLLEACEAAAARRGCRSIVLDVRIDNGPAIAFYRRHGYHETASTPDFYRDGTSAVHMEKPLPTVLPPAVRVPVPHYAQALDHTGGPACLMMAMKHFTPGLRLDRSLEQTLWKESALEGGAGLAQAYSPFALAIAARRRGYQAEVVRATRPAGNAKGRNEGYVNEPPLSRVARVLGVHVARYAFGLEDIAAWLREGLVPITEASAPGMPGAPTPRWVVIVGLDAHAVYVRDPLAKGEALIPTDRFRRMRQEAPGSLESAVSIGPRTSGCGRPLA